MCRRPRRALPHLRQGVSILEFLAYASAMVGGVFLGSMYLGVDVKEMAYCALERVHVIDAQTTADEPATPADVAEAQPTPVVEASVAGPAPAVAASRDTAGAAPAEPAPPVAAEPAIVAAPDRLAPAPAAPAGFFAREDLLTDEQRQALTLAYWDALAACMREETERRVPAIDGEGNWQLFDYLTGRKNGHLQAAEAVAKLDVRGVDAHVIAYAKKARKWHQDGAKLFGRAVDLLTDAPTAQLSGPFAQSWQSAATQHRMEERLLAEKYQAVKSYLDHAYGQDAAAATQQAAN